MKNLLLLAAGLITTSAFADQIIGPGNSFTCNDTYRTVVRCQADSGTIPGVPDPAIPPAPVFERVDEYFVFAPDFDCIMDASRHTGLAGRHVEDFIESPYGGSIRTCYNNAELLSSRGGRGRGRDRGGRRYDRIEQRRRLDRLETYRNTTGVTCSTEFDEVDQTMECVDRVKTYNTALAEYNESHINRGDKRGRRYRGMKHLCSERYVHCTGQIQVQ